MKTISVGDLIRFTNKSGSEEQVLVTNIEDTPLSTYYFIGNRRIARDPRDGSLFEID